MSGGVAVAVVDRLRAAGCVFAEEEAALLVGAAATVEELEAFVQRRVAGLPLEQVVGWAEFCGLRVVVEPGVFVPRRRTEFLVETALALLAGGGRSPDTVVVDLCCGSGAIGLALHAMTGGIQLHAVDVDSAAVRCARRNLDAVGWVYQGDLYQPLPSVLRGRVDLLVANVPYVPTAELPLMPAEAREHEPSVALDGGADGLDLARRVVAEAPVWLRPGGHVLFEVSEGQADAARAMVAATGLTVRVTESKPLACAVVVGTVP